MKNKPKWLICHHEAGNNGFYSVNEYHRRKWNFKSATGFYIGYHFYISKLGKIHRGRLVSEEGIHCRGMNLSSIGICLQGDFNREMPTEAQKTALRGLLSELMKKHNIPSSRIVPHRKFSQTDCYGTNLSDSWAKELVNGRREEVLIKLKERITILLRLVKAKLKILINLKRSQTKKRN